MGFLNGRFKEQPGAGVYKTPAPEMTEGIATSNHSTTHKDSKAVVPPRTGGSPGEVARFMPVMDITQAVQRREAIVDAMKQLMREDVDYGKIPGAGDKPALLQPGADKLCNLFGIVIKYEFEEREEDWSGERHAGEPFFRYLIRGYAYRCDFLLGEGIGECNSRESKYRWRKKERACPKCGKENIRKSREGGWYCWRKTDGCGAVYNDGDPAIESQEVGRRLNPDICDSVNTLIKMAFKRAKLSATINATSAAEFFTQDVEDFTVTEDPIDTGGFRPGTSQAAQHVAQQKLRGEQPLNRKGPWKTMRDMADAFKAMRERIGENEWLGELERYGWHRFQDIVKAIDSKTPLAPEKAAELYWHLDAIARKGVA